MKRVQWTKKTMEFFIEHAMLNEDDCYLLESRVKGKTVREQSLHLHRSESSIHRDLQRIKKLYDVIQEEYPDKLPKRRYSAKETYMDTH